MSDIYSAYFEDGPLAGNVLEFPREANGAPSPVIVSHRAPKLDVNPGAVTGGPDKVAYFLDRRDRITGGKHDGLSVYVYVQGDEPNEHPEHMEATA